MLQSVKVEKGSGGWGGPLTLIPNEKKNKVLCVTGQNIHPVAQKIADLTGCEIVNAFKQTAADEEVLVAVVNCGGTARCGVYPKKNIMTVNLTPVGAVGPLAQFIHEDIYVSGVDESCISLVDGCAIQDAETTPINEVAQKETDQKHTEFKADKDQSFIVRLGVGVGNVVNKFFAAGRDSVDMVIKNVLPFMAFTSTILGVIQASGLGDVIAHTISPLCATLPGMLLISVICALPFLSPVLGPGAVIAQIVGTLLGAEIGLGNIPPQFALPALFAINAQVGADFIPVGLSLGEAEPETVEFGVPAVLYSRVITGPLAVIIAWIFSIGMY